MQKPLDSDDFAIPEGYRIAVGRGWVIASDTDESAPDVSVGLSVLPKRFELFVRTDDPEDVEPSFICSLLFRVNPEREEIVLVAALSPLIDTDLALAHLRSLGRSIDWWKNRAVLALSFQKSLDLADEVKAINQATFGMTEEAAQGAADVWVYKQLQEAKAHSPVGRRRDRITDGLLKEVAETYRAAWAAGDNPTQAVARHFFKSHSTAARWVGMARQSGHLGPSDGSKGGELNT